MTVIYEILCTIIFKYLEFYDKRTFKRTRKFMNRIHITDLFDIRVEYLQNLNDDVLLNYKFALRLYACSNPKISNINHMSNLKVLNASRKCGIDCYGVKNLNLEVLYAYDNPKITNINHMTNLKELDASNNCGINDNCIKNVNLEKLYISYDHKISRVNHMTNLKELEACGDCGIDDDGIANINLEKLETNYNQKITTKKLIK